MNRANINPGIYPFWFWNGLETKPEIVRQLHLAQTAGFRGLAIHARTGNQIPYLSSAWFNLVRHACQTARGLGLKIWLYDEDGYPSGTAGNRIQAEHPELRQQYLTFRYCTAAQCEREPAACFEDTTFRRIDHATVPGDTGVLVFELRYLDSYVDTLNPLTAEFFLKLTHERYYEELSEFFGNTIECVYTDDIDSKMVLASGLPWNGGINEEFRRQYGEELIDLLPQLVEPLSDAGAVRIRYRQLVQQLFIDNFVRPIAAWSARHQVVFTGHLSGDEGPLTRIVNEIGSVMPFQIAEDIPAIDDYLAVMDDCRYLNRTRNHNGLYPVPLFKSGASVAHQFGNGLYSCESMAGLGWDYTMDRQDRQILFELAMGVNIITPHAAYYTIGGPGKQDHPPSYFFQQPYWPQWPELASKWTRIAELLLRGRFLADTLVLYPSSSAWVVHDGNHIIPGFCPRQKPSAMSPTGIEDALASITVELLRLKIGFDLADEFILAEKGRFANGCIHVGGMSYHTVIIPPSVNLVSGVVKLLSGFSQSGGMVINFADTAVAFEPAGSGGWRVALADKLIPDVVLKSPSGDDLTEILVHGRINEEGKELFLLNLSDTDKTLMVSQNRTFAIYDPRDDEIIWEGISWPTNFMLPAWDCCHVLPAAFAMEKRHKELNLTRFVLLKDDSGIELTMTTIAPEQDNVAVLRSNQENPKVFEFATADDRIGIKKIFAEDSDFHNLLLNGRHLSSEPAEAHPCDPCYRGAGLELDLPAGSNRLELTSLTRTVYLTGNFLVSHENGKTALKDMAGGRFEPGNLAEQGLPFYWGSIIYETVWMAEQPVSAAWLDLGTVFGGVEIIINGNPAGVLPASPFRLNIAVHLNIGRNIIRIRLRNTAQNFIRPFQGDKFAPAPFGIYGPVKLIVSGPFSN